ncbi:hypothetical protein [Ensifer adhaerens]|uniref:hypothetical protein n=1 Tax=Ensifer adhaerens TaxID=106592 RepID=UPI0023A97DA7|nr:hypothetical protein [Ensifer adhaerens]
MAPKCSTVSTVVLGKFGGHAGAQRVKRSIGVSANRAQARSQLHGNRRYEVWYSPACPILDSRATMLMGQYKIVAKPVKYYGKACKVTKSMIDRC